jgi:conserved domain protein
MMSYSSLLGTANFNKQLNVLVDENNLSYEDIQQLISEVNRIESIKYNKQLKRELRRIGKLKEKEKQTTDNKFFVGNNTVSELSLFYYNKITNETSKSNILSNKSDILSIKYLKNSENNLRMIE